MSSAGHCPAIWDRTRHLLPGGGRAGDEAAGTVMKSRVSEQTHSTVLTRGVRRERRERDRG